MIALDYDKAEEFISHEIVHLIDVLNTHILNEIAAQKLITDTNKSILNNSNHRKLASNRDEPISVLRSYSLNFSSRILAVANECRHLDNIFQGSTAGTTSKKDFHDLIGSIKHIEDSLSICTDDYKRLVLAYHKYLNIRYDDETAHSIDQNGSESNYASSDTKVFRENVIPSTEESEFFVLSERTEDDDDELPQKRRSNIDDELRQIDAKVIKQHFKPVLRQLRDKIGPINKSMRDRERQFLKKQGIQAEDEAPSKSDSEDSETDSLSISRKRIQHDRKKNQYDEVRQFLQNKQQISFLPPPCLSKMMNEDILE